MRLVKTAYLFPTALNSVLQHWLQQHSPFWAIGLGALLGLGIGAGAVLGIAGIAGILGSLLFLGTVFWWAKDAEPVLVGLNMDLEPRPRQSKAESESEPQLTEPVLVGLNVDLEPQPRQSKADTKAEPESEPRLVEPLDMIALKGGTFFMGSPKSDSEAFPNEWPQHEVTVSDFLISRYPITRQLYRQVFGTSPEAWRRDKDDQRLPANSVNWFEAVAFCNVLSEQVDLQPCYRIEGERVEWMTDTDGYRLPTEAEWEYACRAETTSKWFFSDDPAELDRYAWFSQNSGSRVQAVGEKDPNPWGLHDMIGNVWEWCWDWYADYRTGPTRMLSDPTGLENGTTRVLRGGSAWDRPRRLRSALRNRLEPEGRFGAIGFRCVRRPRRQP